jgi:ribosomal protein S18 acetylase RimI-like enzyme
MRKNMALPVEMLTHVLRHRARLRHRPAQLDALIVLPSGLPEVVGHGIAPLVDKQKPGAIRIPTLKRLHRVVMHQLARRAGVHLYRVFQRRLEGATPLPFPTGYEPAALSQSEALSACAELRLDLSEPSVRAAYAAGGVCVGARQAGALIGYVWFAFEAAPHVAGIWVKVPPGAIYRYKALVLPEHRGKGIAPALYRFADHLFDGMGREAVVNCIATHNFASTAASLRSGAESLGYIGYWQRGKAFFPYHSPAVRALGLRFYTLT